MANAPKRILLLGSTGSVGVQTLDIVRAHPDRLQVVGLAAGSNARSLAEQAEGFGVTRVALADEAAAAQLDGGGLEVRAGVDGVCDLVDACRPDLVVGAISGVAGLRPLLRAETRLSPAPMPTPASTPIRVAWTAPPRLRLSRKSTSATSQTRNAAHPPMTAW